ncbi:hypothetical protein [Vibrio alginolyticus]|uniref:hypothetical protein n=1 Tax=Vibrio alginolyticus TaxID=663 RepID=UPI0007230371|nr:hypothetical protein [Vibrio alginolyticus]ALR95491.1 hypothetical protein AT730_24390 [Vibrio alginolyticus]MBY7710013.1 hypothetical protein [Vibrio alginolyticus]
MKKTIVILVLTLVIPSQSLANFAGFSEKSYSNGQYLVTHFTQTDNSQFHIGCGKGSDYKVFSFVGVKHSSLYDWSGITTIKLSVDSGKYLSIRGGSNKHDDMFYSNDSATLLIREMLLGEQIEVSMPNDEEKIYFSLKGIEDVYTTLRDKCDLLED